MDIAMAVVWVIVLLASIVIELITVQFVSIWFSVSSLISLILAGVGAPRWVQLLVFAAVTALLLLITRPVVKKLRGGFVRTNADLNIGKTAVITEEVCNDISKGRARLGDVSWKAVSADGSVISAGETVTVKDIDGAKLIVSKE